MRNKPLPVFFLCFECPLVGLPPLLAACPCPSHYCPLVSCVPPLPALLSAYHGVGRDGTRLLSRYRLPALPPLLARSGGCLACVRFPRRPRLLVRWAVSVPIVICLLARSVGRFVSVM